jgi:hypothetical protein
VSSVAKSEIKSTANEEHARVIAKAFLRAGARLEVSSRILGQVIGLSEASISRMRAGDAKLLAQGTKPRELATLFLRLYRSLDAIVSGDDSVSAQWLRNRNTAIGDVPLNAIQSVQGLVRVIDYLDARRAVV